MSKVEVSERGIKNRLKSVKPYRAISEYIWNGFDAGATKIRVDYYENELGSIESLEVKDNGRGIPCQYLVDKFTPVLSSEKREKDVQHTLVHGKNGLGRLTFYHFSQSATWFTVYELSGKNFQYSITVDESNIDLYDTTEEEECFRKETGTTVFFKNVRDLSKQYLETEFKSFLKKEFACFLELRRDAGYEILLNGHPLDYSELIKDSERFDINLEGKVFSAEYVRWGKKLNRQSSRYYFLDGSGVLKYSKTTSLNNKSDSFYHSIFVFDEYFDRFVENNQADESDLIDYSSSQSRTFKALVAEINGFLREKRKPFIVDYAASLVDAYESEGVFPTYDAKNKWEAMKAEDLREAVSQLYQVDPRIFNNLNKPQKKTLVRFLSLIVDGGDVEDLFEVLNGVVDLSSSEREVFARHLRTTKMSSIVETIELISDRYKSVDEFRKLVFDPGMYAGEVPHLQKMMEKNYWLIGEEYQLLTAAEPKFEEALRRHAYILRGEKGKKEIEHESKNREMDLFLVRQGKKRKAIENVVVELKHPFNVSLGKAQMDQVYDYYQVIKNTPEFNADNMEWKFFLIGNRFDSTGYIEDFIKALRHHGEDGLAFIGEYKVYVFTWSEIFTDFELKHDFLNEKLQLELGRLAEDEHMSADDIVERKRTSDSREEFSITV